MHPLTTRIYVVFNAYSPTQRAPIPTLISALITAATCFDAGASVCNLNPGLTSQAMVRYSSRRGATSHFFGVNEFMTECVHKEYTICQILSCQPDILLLSVNYNSDWRQYLAIARTLARKVVLVVDECEVDDIDAYVANLKLSVKRSSPGCVLSATIYPDDVYASDKPQGQIAKEAVDTTDVAIMTYSSFDMDGLPLIHGFLESYSYYKDVVATQVPKILLRVQNAMGKTVKYNTLFQVMFVNAHNPFNAVVVGLQGTIKVGNKYTLHRSPVYPESPTEIIVTALYTMECREVGRLCTNEIALLHYKFAKAIQSAVPIIDIGMRITEIRKHNRYCHRKRRHVRTLCLHVRKTITQFEVLATRFVNRQVSLSCGLSNVHGVLQTVRYLPGGWDLQIAIDKPPEEEWFVAWKGDECFVFVLDGDDDMVCGFVKDIY
ncbi:hypothetical protein V1509DRAFT_413834 [Lipomyces kononenkoae]